MFAIASTAGRMVIRLGVLVVVAALEGVLLVVEPSARLSGAGWSRRIL